jgi:hypothetical protein
MAGIGAPIYFALVVGLALRDRGPKVAKSHV